MAAISCLFRQGFFWFSGCKNPVDLTKNPCRGLFLNRWHGNIYMYILFRQAVRLRCLRHLGHFLVLFSVKVSGIPGQPQKLCSRLPLLRLWVRIHWLCNLRTIHTNPARSARLYQRSFFHLLFISHDPCFQFCCPLCGSYLRKPEFLQACGIK